MAFPNVFLQTNCPVRVLIGVLCVCVSLALPTAGPAQALDADEVIAFLDDFLPEAMESQHVPGLAITIVEAGAPLLTRGYGLADIDSGRAVDPETTLFDIQSVSKLMIATSAAIAAEDGSLELDADINTYLADFSIPATYETPISVRALLTHTSGLEDRGVGITVETLAEIQPLGVFLERTLTERIAPPMQERLYTDLGMCLAALTLQSATGIPYDIYARQRIFAPLGMHNTHYLEVPADARSRMASSYSFEDGQSVPVRHDYWNIWPSSSLWTTAADMGRFLSLHLAKGVADGQRVLGPEAIGQLHSRQFSDHPEVPGVALGFFEYVENGRRLLMHSGAGTGFISELVLLPEEGIGWFVTYNSWAPPLLTDLRSAFLDRFFPTKVRADIATIAMSEDKLAAYAGWYWATQNDRRTIEKLATLADGYVRVTATGGALELGERLFHPVDPSLFVNQDAAEPAYIVFRRSDDGRPTQLLLPTSEAPHVRVSWIYSQPAQMLIATLAALTFLSSVICGAVAFLRDTLRGRTICLSGLTFPLLSLANLVTLIVMVVALSRLSRHTVATAFQLGIPPGLQILFGCMTVLAIFNLASPVVAGMAWIRQPRHLVRATLASWVSLISVLYVWFLNTWNVIGFRY